MKIFTRLFAFLLFTFVFGFVSISSAHAATYTVSGIVTNNSSTAISGATVDILEPNTTTVVDTTTTDIDGDYSITIDEGTYDIKVTPSGGSLSPTLALSRHVTSNTTLNFILTPSGTVTLKGKVLDPSGNPIEGQIVNLSILGGSEVENDTTDSNGNYSMQVSSGEYVLAVTANNNSLSLHVPQNYQLRSINFDLTESKILDITVPTKKVDIRVQNASESAISDVIVSNTASCYLANNGTLNIGGGITNATGFNTYSSSTGPATNASGSATLWLLPNSPDCTYTFKATPPEESDYSVTNLSEIAITANSEQTITLQEPVTLNGHVYDPSGNPLEGQTVKLGSTTTTTNSSGQYSLTVAPNDYTLIVSAQDNSLSLHVPQKYELTSYNYSVTEDKNLDITVPAKSVSINVKDAANNPINNVRLSNTASCFIANSGTLNIGGGITNATGFNTYSSSTGPTTDSSGNVILWLVPNSNDCTYTFTATPPGGSEYSTKSVSDFTVTNNTSMNITLNKPVTLSGHVYDDLGNPVQDQQVTLSISGGDTVDTMVTDSEGGYSLDASTGTYDLTISAQNNNFELNVPQNYELKKNNYQLTDDTNLDLTVPAKKVDIHVQNAFAEPISGIRLSNTASCFLANSGTLNIAEGITNATGINTYSSSTGPTTNDEGDVTLWLVPNSNDCTYTFTATPPGGSIYSQIVLNNISITGAETELVSLSYSHSQPVTTATLSPAPYANGEYKGTVTASLSAVPASGYTIANTYYSIDGGEQQTYSEPFTISGVGEHEIVYWSVDNSGVREANKTTNFTISVPPTISLNSIADTFIKEGTPNENEGASTILRVRQSGHNRGLIKFSQAQIESALGSSEHFTAKLRLNITDNLNNWSVVGRTIDAHRLTKNWSEGNGYIAENFPQTRGIGNGATWNCAIDSAIQNETANCSGTTAWNMNTSSQWPFSATPSATTTVFSNQTGVVEFDVTDDVQAFIDGTANYGWLIKKTNEGQAGSMSFGTKESIYDPQLVISIQ